MAGRPGGAGRTFGAVGALTAVAALVALLAASSARAAAQVDVTYDLSDSTAIGSIAIAGATSTTPPDGTVSGTQTIRYASDSAGGLTTGPAELLTFNLYLSSIQVFTDYGLLLNTGSLHFEFLGVASGPSVGQILPGGTVTAGGASGRFGVTGPIHCYVLCAGFGFSRTVPQTISASFQAPLPTLTGAVGQPHIVQGTATGVDFHFIGSLGGVFVNVTGTTFIVGREIARTPVPEPGTLPLLAAGLAGLGFASAAWRRWARAR